MLSKLEIMSDEEDGGWVEVRERCWCEVGGKREMVMVVREEAGQMRPPSLWAREAQPRAKGVLGTCLSTLNWSIPRSFYISLSVVVLACARRSGRLSSRRERTSWRPPDSMPTSQLATLVCTYCAPPNCDVNLRRGVDFGSLV